MNDKLREDTDLSAADLMFKVKRLEGYIKKAERRIASHEKKLDQLEKKMKTQGEIIRRKVLA